MKKNFLYVVIAALASVSHASRLSADITSVAVTSFDYASGMGQDGKTPDVARTAFGWKKINPRSSTINLSFSAKAKQNLIFALQYIDSTSGELSWIEVNLGASGNTTSHVMVCSASNPKPGNSISGTTGTNKIPDTVDAVSYNVAVTPDGTLTVSATTKTNEKTTVLSMQKAWLKNSYSGYSFKSAGDEVVVSGDMLG
jgi:hypothetical protein